MPNQLFDQKFYTGNSQQKSELQSIAVTPSDSADLPNGVCDAIFVTGAGNISIDIPNISNATGATTTQTAQVIAIAANSIMHVPASRIRATSTTATGIQALYKAGNL
jgi:hypothetical protein